MYDHILLLYYYYILIYIIIYIIIIYDHILLCIEDIAIYVNYASYT